MDILQSPLIYNEYEDTASNPAWLSAERESPDNDESPSKVIIGNHARRRMTENLIIHA